MVVELGYLFEPVHHVLGVVRRVDAGALSVRLRGEFGRARVRQSGLHWAQPLRAQRLGVARGAVSGCGGGVHASRVTLGAALARPDRHWCGGRVQAMQKR